MENNVTEDVAPQPKADLTFDMGQDISKNNAEQSGTPQEQSEVKPEQLDLPPTTNVPPEHIVQLPDDSMNVDNMISRMPKLKIGRGVRTNADTKVLVDQSQAMQQANLTFTNESLKVDQHWRDASFILANKFIPEEVMFKTEDEIAEWSIDFMRQFDNDLVDMAMKTFAMGESTPDEKAAMGYAIEAFDRKEGTFSDGVKAAGYMITDPSNIVSFGTLGAGLFLKGGVKSLAKASIKQKFQYAAAVGAIDGAMFGFADDAIRQNMDINIWKKDQFDWLQSGIYTGMGAGIGAGFGAGLYGAGHTAVKGAKKFMDYMERDVIPSLAGGGAPNKHKIAAEYDDAVESLPTITLGELEGKTIVPIIADLTKAGSNYTGIDSSKTSPVALMGGPNYSFLQSSRDGGVVWANKGAHVDSALMKHADEDGFVYGVVTNMLNDSHQSNTSVVHATMETIKAYERDGRLTTDNVMKIKSSLAKHADSMIAKANKEIASGEKALSKAKTKESINDAKNAIQKGKSILNRGNELKNVPDFKDVDNALEYIDGMTFDGRKLLMERMSMNEIGSIKGMPNIGKILDATREAEYSGGQWGDGQVVIKMQVGDAVKLGEDGTIEHPSYSHGIKGEVVGKLGRPIPNQTLFPEFFRDRRALGSDEAGDKRAFSMSQPGQKVTAEMIAENPTTPLKNIKSPRQAQMVKDFADDNWKTSEGSGGVSSADYSKALRQSPASSTLSQHTHQALTSAAKKGSVHYQLGDSQAFFSLSKNTNYSYLNNKKPIPGLTGKETSLNSVINNEQHAPGMGDALVSKAIQQGAEVLDCFNVKTADKPGGILPSYYSKHDFEIVHSAPFDKSFYKDPKALDDIMETWKQQGWSPEDGYPDVVVMKYKGSKDDRARATDNILRGSKEVSARGSAAIDGAGVQRLVTDGGESVSGDKPRAGSVNAIRGEEPGRSGTSNVSRVYDELGSLSDKELVNLHINERTPITMSMEEKLGRVNDKLSKTKDKKARKKLLDRINEILSEEE